MTLLEIETKLNKQLKNKNKKKTLIQELNQKALKFRTKLSNDAWKHVKLARHQERPTSLDYINMIFDSFVELHGDRLYRDDPSIVGGIGKLNGVAVTIIAEQKGKTTEENIKRNFGMPHPEGYRKALRLMKQAEKFKRPVITFVDTPGAYPGIGAEERGQAEAIARNLFEMSQLRVPIISIVIGEGGSGGALAIAVANEVVMLEYSIYSILSPEGFASIVWKDATLAEKAAKIMKITAADLLNFKVIDDVIFEPHAGVHMFPLIGAYRIKNKIERFLKKYENRSQNYIVNHRYKKYRDIGVYQRMNSLL